MKEIRIKEYILCIATHTMQQCHQMHTANATQMPKQRHATAMQTKRRAKYNLGSIRRTSALLISSTRPAIADSCRAICAHDRVPTESRTSFPCGSRRKAEEGLHGDHRAQGDRTCKVVRGRWNSGERMGLVGGRRRVGVPVLDYWEGLRVILGVLAV